LFSLSAGTSGKKRAQEPSTPSPAEVLAAIADKANLWILAGFRHLRSLAALVNQSYNVK
jgi:hypothetical protein